MSDTPMTDDRIVYGTLSGDDSIGVPWVNAPFARQLERELNAAYERIKRLEEFVEQLTNPKFTRDDLPKEELLQHIKRLEEAGDQLSKWADRNTPVTILNDWTAAKEAKP